MWYQWTRFCWTKGNKIKMCLITSKKHSKSSFCQKPRWRVTRDQCKSWKACQNHQVHRRLSLYTSKWERNETYELKRRVTSIFLARNVSELHSSTSLVEIVNAVEAYETDKKRDENRAFIPHDAEATKTISNVHARTPLNLKYDFMALISCRELCRQSR